jgi:cytochrome c-type biogenesis protein CcmE
MRKLAVPVVLILLGVATLLALSISAGGIPEIQARELASGAFDGREVKVHGLLHAIQSDQRPLRFQVRDKDDPTAVIDVVADETRPDTFQVTYDVAVQGRWHADRRSFEAEKVFTKCPSKYEEVGGAGIGSEEAYRTKTGKDFPADAPAR